MKVAIQSGFKLASRAQIDFKLPSAHHITPTAVPSQFEIPRWGSLLVCNPREFAALRELEGLNHDAYFASLTQDELLGGSVEESGKSGSIFWYSKDSRFVLKTVAEDELQNLLGILPKYARYLMGHRDSLLTRYFGAYRFTPARGGDVVRIVVMKNVLDGAKPHKVFDLKGTTEDRWVEELDGKCLKDINFQSLTVHLRAETHSKLHLVLQHDTRFLEHLQIMDYSLLVSVQYITQGSDTGTLSKAASQLMGGLDGAVSDDRSYRKTCEPCILYFGIIDMLTTYNLKKKLAHALKSNTIAHFCDIDTEPPDVYAERFRSYFKHNVIAETEGLRVKKLPATNSGESSAKTAPSAPIDLLTFDSLSAPAVSSLQSRAQSSEIGNLLDFDFPSDASPKPCVSTQQGPTASSMPMNFDLLSFDGATDSAGKSSSVSLIHQSGPDSFDLLA